MRKFQYLLFALEQSYTCYYIICTAVPLNDGCKAAPSNAKMVKKTKKKLNETEQDENNVDKEARLLPRTDNRKHYCQQCRERQRNVKSLEEVVNRLSSTQKQKVKQ